MTDDLDGELDQFTFFFGAASGSSRKALRKLEEPNVMLNYATKMNEPWSGIDRLFVDSGGYSFMKGKGEYGTTDAEYLDFIEEHDPEQFALRDYPCEPDVLSEHGRNVRDHQRMTTERHVSLLDKLEDRDIDGQPISVLQGWNLDDYLSHIDELRDHDALTEYVGIGSVCRRNQEAEIRQIVLSVSDALPSDTKVHAFGVKGSVLQYPDVRQALTSADSQSYEFRKQWAVLHDLGPGKTSWKDSAFHYLKQRQQIRALLAGDDDSDTEQQTLKAMTDGGRDQSGDEVLWTYDRESDTYYRIGVWSRTGTGDVVPKHVEEVLEERVPPEHRRNTIGLNRGVLN